MFHLVWELWPIFGFLYLMDTLTYLGSGHLLFFSHGARQGRFRLQRSGFRWLGLRPDSRAFSAEQRLIALTPAGIFLPKKQDLGGAEPFRTESYHFLKYEELDALEVEHHTVLLGRGRSVKLPSPTRAHDLGARLGELLEMPAEKRTDHLEKHQRATDLKALREQLDTLAELRLPLELLCWFLTFITFAAIPATMLLTSWVVLMAALLGILAAGHVAVLTLAVSLARSIRQRGMAHLRGVLAPIFLSPPAALRAPVNVPREALQGFDDLTLAAVFLPSEELVRIARLELHGAEYALSRDGDIDWNWYWQGRRQTLVKLLNEVGSSEEEALEPPLRLDVEAESYCPFCLGEYRRTVTRCEDCGEALAAFEA